MQGRVLYHAGARRLRTSSASMGNLTVHHESSETCHSKPVPLWEAMACVPGSDESFGPRINPQCRSFDFTLDFEDIIFACIPAVVFLCLLPASLAMVSHRSCSFSSRSGFLACKMVCSIIRLLSRIPHS